MTRPTELDPRYVNRHVIFPYGLKVEEVEKAAAETYRLFHGLNDFLEILCAKLNQSDWSFSGRKGTSRRTPTASITKSGVEKLRSSFLYRLPGVGIGRHRDFLCPG